MGVAGGPNIVRDGLVFAIDSDSNVRGFTKYGTSGTNNNHRAIRNLVDRSSTFSTTNTSQLTGGVAYYTLYGLTYPESSQTPASRDGVTPGFENTTAAKTYAASRDLNYYVFDEDTNTWVADSYFNGERISGHCYDTYDGEPSQHATFQADFDNIKNTFPNATHIVIGSHAAENNVSDSATKSRLESIGLPSDHTSGTRWEYVLVGKIGKPWTHHYVRENVSSAVANMVIGLPLEGKGGALTFDGTDDYIAVTNLLASESIGAGTQLTISLWLNCDQYGDRMPFSTGQSGDDRIYYWTQNSLNTWRVGNYTSTTGHGSLPSVGNWFNTVLVIDGTNITVYLNGQEDYTGSYTGFTTEHYATFGRHGATSSYYYDGKIANAKIYNRALTAQEVQQNYKAYKNRFNL